MAIRLYSAGLGGRRHKFLTPTLWSPTRLERGGKSTRSELRWNACAAPESGNAFFQPRHIITQTIDLARKIAYGGARRNQWIFFSEILGEVSGEVLRRAGVPCAKALSAVDEAMGGNVANDFGKVFFNIPLDIADDETQGFGKIYRAG